MTGKRYERTTAPLWISITMNASIWPEAAASLHWSSGCGVDSLGLVPLSCIGHRRIHDIYPVVTVNAVDIYPVVTVNAVVPYG